MSHYLTAEDLTEYELPAGPVAAALFWQTCGLLYEYRSTPYHLHRLHPQTMGSLDRPYWMNGSPSWLTLYQPMTHMCVMSSHKPIRIYMGGLILGVNTLYSHFIFFKLFPMVGKGSKNSMRKYKTARTSMLAGWGCVCK